MLPSLVKKKATHCRVKLDPFSDVYRKYIVEFPALKGVFVHRCWSGWLGRPGRLRMHWFDWQARSCATSNWKSALSEEQISARQTNKRIFRSKPFCFPHILMDFDGFRWWILELRLKTCCEKPQWPSYGSCRDLEAWKKKVFLRLFKNFQSQRSFSIKSWMLTKN